MKFEYFREIPSDLDPNFANTLVHCKHKVPKDDSGVYSAILLSLARKNYIELEELPNKDVKITIKNTTWKTPAPTPAYAPMYNTWQPIQQMPQQNIPYTTWQAPQQNTPYTNWQMPQQNIPYTTWQMPQQNTPYTNWQAPQQNTPYTNWQVPQQNIMPQTNIPNIDVTDTVMPEPETPTYNNMDVPTVDTPIAEAQVPETEYEPLTPCEQYYFNLLVRHARNNATTMKIFQARVSQDYQNTDSFVRNMSNSIVNIGIEEGYFQKADYTAPQKKMRSKATFFMVIGIIFLTLVNIISYHTRMDLAFGAYFIFGIACIIGCFTIRKQSNSLVLLSPFGEDEYEKWRGLYNFLNSETLMSDRTVVELPLWEKYLVYATAFGISDKVIKAISLKCPDASSSAILSNNYCRSGRIRHSGRSFRSSVRSGSSAARSGGGGGFGYGGGGRGGGGGGGGH